MTFLLAENSRRKWPSITDMAWTEPRYSRTRIDKAAKYLLDSETETAVTDDFKLAVEIVSDWRSAHLYPLSVFREILDAVNVEFGEIGLAASRLKRMRSILWKLLTAKESMRLTQMQDIGGCRLVVGAIEQVRIIDDALRERAAAHELVDIDDYILNPKPSGYRSTHLVYRYRGQDPWNGLLIEVQLRSQLQHAWAAAVETVDKFTSGSSGLKSGFGDEKWREFFRLMGAAIALKEGCSPVPEAPAGRELMEAIRRSVIDLGVIRRLKAWRDAVQIVGSEQGIQEGDHFLIKFDLQNSRVLIQSFMKDELQEATKAYKAAEEDAKELARQSPQILQDVVLVSVETTAELKAAYPSYFADTEEFIRMVEGATNLISNLPEE